MPIDPTSTDETDRNGGSNLLRQKMMEALNAARSKLLERSLRNKLISKSLLEHCDAFLNSYSKLKDSVALDETLAFDGRPLPSLSVAELSPIRGFQKRQTFMVQSIPSPRLLLPIRQIKTKGDTSLTKNQPLSPASTARVSQPRQIYDPTNSPN
jgi:hypothetical protein